MPTDLAFYAAATTAVVLVGLAKGGFGGALALIGVPILALVVSPVKAAAIMLPILIVMDIASLWAWRHYNDMRTLKYLVPGSVVGLSIGWITAAWLDDALIQLLLGCVAVIFVARMVYQQFFAPKEVRGKPAPHNPVKGTFWGTVAGFTSFVSHAGGPPFQIYTVPLKLDPKLFAGTSARFFAIMNALKLGPYFALGQFDTSNLATSAVLLPLAPLATLAGAWIVKRMSPKIFYPFMYVLIVLTGLKLVADGLLAVMQ